MIPNFNPFQNPKDRIKITNDLGEKIVFQLQDNVRYMPTNLVAAMLLLNRKGISQDDLQKKVIWLGTTLVQRGYNLSTEGLPSTNTLKIGITHLQEYLDKKRDILEPSVVPKVDYKNYLMLGYYRNPLNHIFFNEGCVIVAMNSYG